MFGWVGELWDEAKDFWGATEAATDATAESDHRAGLPGVLVYGSYWSTSEEMQRRAEVMVAELQRLGWTVGGLELETEKASSGLPRQFGFSMKLHRTDRSYTKGDAESAVETAVARIDDLLGALAGGAGKLGTKLAIGLSPVALGLGAFVGWKLLGGRR